MLSALKRRRQLILQRVRAGASNAHNVAVVVVAAAAAVILFFESCRGNISENRVLKLIVKLLW